MSNSKVITNHENPAFPQPGGDARDNEFNVIGGGISMRDYFAAHAVSGILSREQHYQFSVVATFAYAVADEMIKARDIPPKPNTP